MLHKYWKDGDMECAVPVEPQRTLDLLERVVSQNELILRAILANPLADRKMADRNTLPLQNTECNSKTPDRHSPGAVTGA